MEELEAAFKRYGKASVGLKNGFAFVRYERSRDAEEAIRNLSGRSVCGSNLRIEWSTAGSGRDNVRGGGGGGGGGGRDRERGCVRVGVAACELLCVCADACVCG